MKNHIFDLDGVIADSMTVWGNSFLQLFERDGIPIPDGFLNKVTPLPIIETSKLLFDLGIKEESPEIICKKIKESMLYHYVNTIKLKKSVAQYLEKLKSEGHRLYVLTASPHLTVDPCLKRNGVYDMFEKVFSTDDFACPKSDPKIYGTVAKEIGSKISEMCFYDDNLDALTAAKQAGLYVTGVYDETSALSRAEIERIADRYIFTFDELL